MRIPILAASAVTLVAIAASGAALAGTDGGSGGDREPAGGAFNSSYLAPGTTGIQDYGPPRSVDISRAPSARGYGHRRVDADETGSIDYAPAARQRVRR